MESPKKGVISKIWKRYKSFSDINEGKRSPSLRRHSLDENKVATVGYFPIYVGSKKQRFVIKTEQVNHPLFKSLLEQAEYEYGYDNKGPLTLPCQVDYFVQVLMEMDYSYSRGKEKGYDVVSRSYSSYHFLSPQRVIAMAR